MAEQALDALQLFALGASRRFGEDVARHLGVDVQPLEEREFEDGEHKARPLVTVRGNDVFVVQSLHGDADQTVNDKLCRLWFFIGALKNAGARAVTAVVPYLAYSRKDRRTQPRDPLTTQYVARLFEAAGTDRVVTLDVHNLAAFENAFRCPSENLQAKKLFTAHFVERLQGQALAVVSPDAGGVKRAEIFRRSLERGTGQAVTLGLMQKHRARGVVSGESLAGEVTGRVAIVLDDLISTGTTLMRAVSACEAAGAARVVAAASHGLFTADADRVLSEDALAGLVITDTVLPIRLQNPAVLEKLTVLPAAPLFAHAIARLHGGGSIADLLD